MQLITGWIVCWEVITEFSIDCTQSYSVVERELFKGLCGRYLKSLSTWIKMLLCDKGVMKMEYEP
jgi:hypothetical protein